MESTKRIVVADTGTEFRKSLVRALSEEPDFQAAIPWFLLPMATDVRKTFTSMAQCLKTTPGVQPFIQLPQRGQSGLTIWFRILDKEGVDRNMANIERELKAIMEAEYGEEVRSSIHDAH